MSEHTWFIVAIVMYMLAMLAIGYWSYRQTSQYDDYMLAPPEHQTCRGGY